MEEYITNDSNGIMFFSILGIFFVLPCIESYQKVDLRTITLSVPPQEVSFKFDFKTKYGKEYFYVEIKYIGNIR